MCYRCPHATERGRPQALDDQEPSDHGAALPEPLDFDTWAALSAALLDLDASLCLALLAEAGIAPDHWTRSDHHHRRALVDDLAADRMDRASAYAALCAAEKSARRLAAPPDAHATLAPLPPAPSPAPTPASVAPPLRVLPARGTAPAATSRAG
jgi:hypothetical protein